MKVLVKIDRESIKKNPNGGQCLSEWVPGPWRVNADGSKSRSAQFISSMYPEPHYTFNYYPCVAMCEHCLSKFPKEDLVEVDETYFDGHEDCEIYYYQCPVCERDSGCEFEFEKLNSKGEVE